MCHLSRGHGKKALLSCPKSPQYVFIRFKPTRFASLILPLVCKQTHTYIPKPWHKGGGGRGEVRVQMELPVLSMGSSSCLLQDKINTMGLAFEWCGWKPVT